MSTLAWQKRAIAAAIGAMTFAAAGSAAAGGFAIGAQNGSGIGNANSGQAAAAEDASTIFFNPAGMTNLPGRQVVGSLNVLNISTDFSIGSGTTLPPAITTGATNNGGDAGDWAAVPNAYLSWQINPQLWLGLGIGSPFGLKTEWDPGWVGRFHAIKSEILTINVNPSIAWKINDTFSLGFGLNAMYIDAELTNSVDYSAIAIGAGAGGLINPTSCPGSGPGPANCEGVAKVKADDWGWGWNVGAMINASPSTRVGLSYRSEIRQKPDGDVNFSNRPAFLNAAVPDSGVNALVDLPAMGSVALSQQLGPQWQILVDYTYTWWDSIQDLTIVRSSGATLSNTPLRFKNSWRFGIGANYQLNDQWKLRFGWAYDKTPVQDEFRTPRLPDESRNWLAFGAQWRFSKQGALDFGYAHEFVDDASSQLLSASPPAAPQGNLFGEYKASVDIFAIQLRYAF